MLLPQTPSFTSLSYFAATATITIIHLLLPFVAILNPLGEKKKKVLKKGRDLFDVWKEEKNIRALISFLSALLNFGSTKKKEGTDLLVNWKVLSVVKELLRLK